MGFKAGLKNAGKWYRVNQLLREKPDFETAVNANPGVHGVLVELDTILVAEATTAGVADQFTDRLATNGLPVPLRVWQGRLVYSHRTAKQKGLTANQKQFRIKAKNLRDHVDTMIRSFSMLDDAFDQPAEKGPNPGGELGEG